MFGNQNMHACIQTLDEKNENAKENGLMGCDGKYKRKHLTKKIYTYIQREIDMYVHGCNIRDNIEVVKKERLQDICIKKEKAKCKCKIK